MRENHPVYFDPSLDAWILTSHDDVSTALRSPMLSVDRNGQIGRGESVLSTPSLVELNEIMAKWMVFSDPPRHTRLRGAVARAFSPHALKSLTTTVQEIVDKLLDTADRYASWDVLRDLGIPVAERVTAHMLGIPQAKAPTIKKWTEDIFAFVGSTRASEAMVQRSAAGVQAFREYVRALVEARQKTPGEDLVSQVIRDSGSEFTEEEIVGLVITLVAGAYETTAHSITTGLYLLLRHPEQLERLRGAKHLIEGTVEETLRYASPAFAVQRRTLSDLTIRDEVLHKGDRIYCVLHAANHDPAVFDDPGTFDIERTQGKHLALGLGPHFCLGAWLTRMETQIAIQRTLLKFPQLKPHQDFVSHWAGNFAIRGLDRVVVLSGNGPRDSTKFSTFT
jgi:cytochrome P450